MYILKLPALNLALGLFAASPVIAASFTVDNVPGRLPKDVVPVHYQIAIVPNGDALTLTGRESVSLQVRKATRTLKFNSLDETLSDVRLDGKPVKQFASSDALQLTTVELSKRAAAGAHTLSFAYTGKIETQPRGLFAQGYASAAGEKALLLSTQMEATDARRMFPCWDEPAFRATFDLTVTVPAAWTVIANMPVARRVEHGKLATTTFERTPKMPSYLLEFTAGNMREVSAVRDGVKFGVWAVSGSEQNGQTALGNAQIILGDYDEYFGYRYPLPKLDSIGLPGGFQGAMENWGAITYNDQVLLLSSSSTVHNRQQVFSIQAHEMAHQWNGDLVTMGWWDDIWLNESFASWMAARETDLRNPDWKWWEGQDGDKEDAMRADARASSHAIQQTVTDELQALNAFDPEITYSKGQAILRMLEAYLGPEIFRNGIRAFMREHAFSNATTADLWKALNTASGKDAGGIAADWTGQAGFPLVEVAAQCDAAGARTLTFKQRRFFLLQGVGPASQHWRVPLQIRSGDGPLRALLLDTDGQTTEGGRCDDTLSVDAGALGFFRTRYDAKTLALDTKNFSRLPDADGIALLDDQWALVEAAVDPLPTYLALAESMGPSLDTRAWTQIAEALRTIEFAERGGAGYENFSAYARSLLRPALERLGWDVKSGETPDVQQLRLTIIRDLGSFGEPAVIEEARKRFAAFELDHAALPPDYQSPVLRIVAQHADAATFERLHSVARAARDETELRRYYSALVAVGDPELAARAAQISLSPEIPAQTDAFRLGLITTLAARHQQLSWQVFRDHHEQLLKPFGESVPFIVAQYLPEAYWSGVPTAELETWVRGQVPAKMASSVERGMETVRFRVAEKGRLIQAADSYLRR